MPMGTVYILNLPDYLHHSLSVSAGGLSLCLFNFFVGSQFTITFEILQESNLFITESILDFIGFSVSSVL